MRGILREKLQRKAHEAEKVAACIYERGSYAILGLLGADGITKLSLGNDHTCLITAVELISYVLTTHSAGKGSELVGSEFYLPDALRARGKVRPHELDTVHDPVNSFHWALPDQR